MKPKRIQRKRTKGWRMPEGAKYCGRPTIFGNPFAIGLPDPVTGEPMTPTACVAWYRRGLEGAAKAWTGEVGSIFRPEMNVVYDAWESRAPHLRYAEIDLRLEELRGRDLACFCRLDQPCHVDVLLEFANR